MTEHPPESDLILLYYGEVEDAAPLKAHLTECPACRIAFDELCSTLDRIADDPEPPAPGLEQRVWTSIRGQIPAARSNRWHVLAPLVAIAAMLVVAFFLGRKSAEPVPGVAAVSPRERVLLIALGQHLERARIVVTEIANASVQQELAEDLLDSNRLYRQAASAAGEVTYEDLLADVERVLLEAVHGGDPEALRRQIDEEALLFRLQVIESQVEARQPEVENSL